MPGAIHFADDLLAEIGEAVVRGLVGGRIRPIVVEEMSERHITNAERGEGAKGAEIIVNHMTALDTHQNGDFAVGMGAAHFFSSGSQREIFRMENDLAADGVNLINGALDGFRAGDAAGNPNREKDRA